MNWAENWQMINDDAHRVKLWLLAVCVLMLAVAVTDHIDCKGESVWRLKTGWNDQRRKAIAWRRFRKAVRRRILCAHQLRKFSRTP